MHSIHTSSDCNISPDNRARYKEAYTQLGQRDIIPYALFAIRPLGI